MITDPVGYWPMNELSGSNVADQSGTGNTGTATGTTIVLGKFGMARSFNGTSGDFISIPDSASLQLSTALTISAWYRTSDATANRAILRKDTCGTTRYIWGLQMNRSGSAGSRVSATYANGTGFDLDSIGVTRDGTWHNAMMTISGTTLSLYSDGVFQASTTISGTQNPPTGELTIGCNPLYGTGCAQPRAEFINGEIQQVRIYNRALSATELHQLYLFGLNHNTFFSTRPGRYKPGLAR